MYVHMQFRWLGQLGPGPMLGRHVNECATYYIRMCTLIFGVSPLGLIQSQEKYITSNLRLYTLAFHRLVCVTVQTIQQSYCSIWGGDGCGQVSLNRKLLANLVIAYIYFCYLWLDTEL